MLFVGEFVAPGLGLGCCDWCLQGFTWILSLG